MTKKEEPGVGRWVMYQGRKGLIAAPIGGGKWLVQFEVTPNKANHWVNRERIELSPNRFEVLRDRQ